MAETSVANRQVQYHMIMMGCDPELFFEREGRIIGAEKVVPEAGISTKGSAPEGFGKDRHFVLDGVQIEMNPNAHPCRANLTNEFRVAFKALKKHLQEMTGVTASFRSVIEVDKIELDSLSEKSRILGCAPSNNIYDSKARVNVNPKTYRKRSAGGHIHVGLTAAPWYKGYDHLMKVREELVPLMDVLVGLPSVLVDRDPLAAERRKVYGRAGEHRLPAHGVEYRTLSNFWIRSNQLMSMVMGLTRLAVSVLATEYYVYETSGYSPKYNAKVYEATNASRKWPAATTLLGKMDMEAVVEAINTNNRELALQQFQNVKSFIAEHVREGDYGLNSYNLEAFDIFVNQIHEKGIESWFPQDPIEHWCNIPEGHCGVGFESFLNHVENLRNNRVSTYKTTY